jgi:predicted DNA-binding protein (MmcQ/YjbR family)
MNAEEIRDYCLAKKGVQEDTPFGPETLVFKVAGKLFLLLSLDASPLRLNLKCNPEKAIELREQYPAVLPGYHMNKKHWNTVVDDDSLPKQLIYEWIDDSYLLVVNALSQKVRNASGV